MNQIFRQDSANSKVDISVMLASFENKNLLETLQTFSKTLERYGYFVPVYSEDSLLKLQNISSEKKEQIRAYFENWNSWIQPSAGEPLVIPTDAKKEVYFAKRALKHYGLHIDENFWATVQNEHIVEIYGEDMIQMYRSLSFFKFCSYSLLDISLNEWYVLWERSKKIIEAMEKDVIETMSNALTVFKFRVPKHLLREMLVTGSSENFQAKACLVDFQYIGILKKNPLSPKPCAFICTSSAEIVAKGDGLQILALSKLIF